MPRALAALALIALLALPIGLSSSLLADALLRVGVWLDAPALGSGPAAGRTAFEAELAGTVAPAPLARWRSAASDALADPLPVGLPYAETLLAGLEASDAVAGAHAFELRVEPPRVLRIASLAAAGASGGLLVDVFDADDLDAEGRPRALASYGPGDLDARLPVAPATPPRAARLIVRVQPAPGAVGRFALALDALPALGFPVATDAPSPVRSFFGMPRDGGRREHHGIDVFAARGTPVLAAADGVIVRTGDSARGGLHVWQRAVDDAGDALGALYYAHLDRVDVAAGARVTRGTPLGTVGNTGNARTTPPHLHFGLYRRFSGPEDPLPLTGERRVTPTPLDATDIPPASPRWLAVRPARANLRRGPGTDRDVVGEIRRGDLVRVDATAADGRWVRVRTGGGVRAWIARSLLGAYAGADVAALDGLAGADGIELRAGPDPTSATLGRIEGAAAEPLGRFGAALRLRTGDGLVGWTSVQPAP